MTATTNPDDEILAGDTTVGEARAILRTLTAMPDNEMSPALAEYKRVLTDALMWHRLATAARANTPAWREFVKTIGRSMYAEVHAGHGPECICAGEFADHA